MLSHLNKLTLLTLLTLSLLLPVKLAAQSPTCTFGEFEAGLPGFEDACIDNIVQGGTPFLSLIGFLAPWLVVLVVGTALIVIVAAGYKYMIAGGDGGKVEDAKKMIGAALLGIFLALGSYMLLNTISSQFATDDINNEPRLIVPSPNP